LDLPAVMSPPLRPAAHVAGGSSPEPGPAATNPPGLGPAGTAHCSLKDYGKFLSMLATGTPELIKPATLKRLYAPQGKGNVRYAGGWMVVTAPKGRMLVYGVSNTLWYATAVVLPEKHVAFVVATNKGDEKLEGSLERLLKRYLE